MVVFVVVISAPGPLFFDWGVHFLGVISTGGLQQSLFSVSPPSLAALHLT